MKKNNWIFWLAVILLLLTALISEFKGEERIKELTIFSCENSSALKAVLESGRVDTVNIFCPVKEDEQLNQNFKEFIRIDENDNETCYTGVKDVMTEEVLYEEKVRCDEIKIVLSEPLGFGGG